MIAIVDQPCDTTCDLHHSQGSCSRPSAAQGLDRKAFLLARGSSGASKAPGCSGACARVFGLLPSHYRMQLVTLASNVFEERHPRDLFLFSILSISWFNDSPILFGRS